MIVNSLDDDSNSSEPVVRKNVIATIPKKDDIDDILLFLSVIQIHYILLVISAEYVK